MVKDKEKNDFELKSISDKNIEIKQKSNILAKTANINNNI